MIGNEWLTYFENKRLCEERVLSAFKGYGITSDNAWSITGVIVNLYQVNKTNISPVLKIEHNRNNNFYFCSEILKQLRVLFFNSETSKWKLRHTIKSLEENCIELERFNHLFEMVITSHHIRNNKGKKTNFNFLKSLKRKEGASIKMKSLSKDEYVECLEELRGWKEKYVNTNQKDFISFIHENFNMPYKISTLRRMYFDDPDK